MRKEATFIVELSREVDDINASRSFGRKGAIRYHDALMVWSREWSAGKLPQVYNQRHIFFYEKPDSADVSPLFIIDWMLIIKNKPLFHFRVPVFLTNSAVPAMTNHSHAGPSIFRLLQQMSKETDRLEVSETGKIL